MKEESFLARWSRRKEEARRSERPDPRPPAVAAASERGSNPEPTLGPDELARLPKLDELTPGSDIRGFLRPGVPEAIRNAALRKMWLLDPAIRDFPGHARDYAYDWNTPGGTPGSAPLERGEVAALLRQVLGASNRASAPTLEHTVEKQTSGSGEGGTGPGDDVKES